MSAIRHDLGSVMGIGIARGYMPEVLAVKTSITDLLLGRGWEGLALEDESLRLLAREGLRPCHEARSRNTLVNGGTAIMLDALIGVAVTYYTNAVAALGVGDSAAAFALTQINLQGAVVTTDRIRKAMNATFPSRAANVVSWQATFATGEANFTWNEWAIFNAVADATGTMLNRAVNNLGTKTNATAWQLTVTLTQS